MAKRYFLGSVGKAEAFRLDSDGHLQLAFVSNTLTDSGLNIQTTKEDIRGGQGAPIQFSFYHDPSVEITLTDVLWKPEYLTAQLGAEFDDTTQEDYISDKVDFGDDASVSFTKEVLPLPMACYDGNKYAVWGAPVGTSDWDLLTYDPDAKTLTKSNATAGEYCLRYLGKDSRAKVAEISTQIIPEILLLVITAPIFAGDSCSSSKGKAAGHITFEVPKFQLNGAQEFQMNMSSNQTMSLSGIALASDAADCDAVGGKLLRIIQVINDYNYLEDIDHITYDEEFAKAGDKPVIFGIKKDGKIVKINNTDVYFNDVKGTDSYVLPASGAVEVELKSGDETVDACIINVIAQ